jgi:hypothetical protein
VQEREVHHSLELDVPGAIEGSAVCRAVFPSHSTGYRPDYPLRWRPMNQPGNGCSDQVHQGEASVRKANLGRCRRVRFDQDCPVLGSDKRGGTGNTLFMAFLRDAL